MAHENFLMLDGHKFMWDGAEYETKNAAEDKMKEYSNDDFEVRLIEKEEKFLVYTRRVVTEIVLEGDAPI